MAGVLLEHQLHGRHLDTSDLRAGREAHGLIAGLYPHFLAEELFDLDLALGLFVLELIAVEARLAVVLILGHHHEVLVHEADLLHVLQWKHLKVLDLGFLAVKHVEAALGRDCDHIKFLIHGEGDGSLALHMFSSSIQRCNVKLLHHLLRLKVDLGQLQVAEENEAAIVQ